VRFRAASAVGTLITSFTLTVKFFFDMPTAFVAVQLRLTEPIMNKEPDCIS
jgi:hypothetical protein